MAYQGNATRCKSGTRILVAFECQQWEGDNLWSTTDLVGKDRIIESEPDLIVDLRPRDEIVKVKKGAWIVKLWDGIFRYFPETELFERAHRQSEEGDDPEGLFREVAEILKDRLAGCFFRDVVLYSPFVIGRQSPMLSSDVLLG